MLSFGDHATVHRFSDLFNIVDPFDFDIHQFNAERGQLGLGLGQYALGDFFAAGGNRIIGPFRVISAELTPIKGAVGFANGLDQLIRSDKISDGRVNNIVESTDGVKPVVDGLEKLDRIRDFPAGKCIDPDKCLVKGGDLTRVTIPIQQVFCEKIGFLDKGNLKLKTRIFNWLSNNFAELGNDDLLGFIDAVGRVVCKKRHGKYQYNKCSFNFHFSAPLWFVMFNRGRIFFCSESTIYFGPSFGNSVRMVSRYILRLVTSLALTYS